MKKSLPLGTATSANAESSAEHMLETTAPPRTFEQRLERLEEIVALLDGGEAPLEQLLVLYEEGIMLSKECSTFLQFAEQKITTLSKTAAA